MAVRLMISLEAVFTLGYSLDSSFRYAKSLIYDSPFAPRLHFRLYCTIFMIRYQGQKVGNPMQACLQKDF